MQSTNTETYQLGIEAEGQMKAFASILVYNGYNEIVGKGWGSFQQALPRGIYRISLAINEFETEWMIRLDKDVRDVFPIPATSSSVVAEGFNSTHEYYSENAMKWSKTPTVSSGEQANASLFLFFRYHDEITAKEFNALKNLGTDFLVLNSRREMIYDLSDQLHIKKDSEFGWLAFHAPVPDGQYYLHYGGKVKREFPLYVFEDWQTQVFLTYGQEPVFGSMKILFGKVEDGFSTTNQKNYALEAILQKLYNGIYFIPQPLIEEIASGKWEHPMLAIVGAYVYLHNEEETQNDGLFSIILKNLETKILHNSEAPDIIALNILYALHRKQPYDGPALREPCMLLAGMKAAIKASAQNPHIIPSKTIAESVVMNMYDDAVWTSYKPKPVLRAALQTKERSSEMPNLNKDLLKVKSRKKALPDDGESAKPKLPKPSKTVLNSWVTSSVLNYLESNQKKTDMVPSINQLAEQLQVTPGIVANSLSNLQQFMQQSSGSIQPDEKGKKLTWFGFKASELITGNTLNQVQSMLKKTDL